MVFLDLRRLSVHSNFLLILGIYSGIGSTVERTPNHSGTRLLSLLDWVPLTFYYLDTTRYSDTPLSNVSLSFDRVIPRENETMGCEVYGHGVVRGVGSPSGCELIGFCGYLTTGVIFCSSTTQVKIVVFVENLRKVNVKKKENRVQLKIFICVLQKYVNTPRRAEPIQFPSPST